MSTQTRSRCERATTHRDNRSRGVLAIVAGCALAAALLTAGSASAASRGFKVHNHSNHGLILEAAKPVPTYICRDLTLCVPTHSPMDFEGRPANGAALNPGHTHDWELKYGFSPFGGVQYAANLWYQISGTNGTVEFTIETWSTSNESACRVNGAAHFTCTAAGTKLTFKNK
ncbi:MAG: hypothetical protein ACXVSL_12660 [Solirubrobacteraceae bacterium]